MNTKKLILIFIIVILFTAALLTIININFFKELPLVSPEPKEETVAVESPKLNYAIPTTGLIYEADITELTARRNAVREKEIKAGRARSIRRAAAFGQQKEAENTLLNAAHRDPKQTTVVLPAEKKETPPTDEDIKKLESEGILSY